ncbi:hypothetical protein CROQUDRAFT_596798 [Cronartium quercuum f. sp. fusiforme G11]|uniref:Uncharacterized protein n=1 Tax=Cronartium quercuum f. sp. fusiforme G11 TaxID=708437 RepID=A0A9P6TAT4_9BASI|nr:hypothetical protein CROQUDRAFT_596798 [Cronartium quercuum f. sp. fusiforme G11]
MLSTSKGLEDMENVHQFNHLVTCLLMSSSNVDPSQPKQAPLDPQAALQIVKVLMTFPRFSNLSFSFNHLLLSIRPKSPELRLDCIC